MPLLNPSQLVTSWRELLPDHRDPEFRRVPLELKEPGLYVVEAVNGTLRAYTLLVVSDVGLVTKTAPGQIVLFAADRFTGEPRAECDVRVLATRQAVAQGRTTADGAFEATLPESASAGQVLGLVRCGEQVAATDPGAYALQQPASQLAGYIYTDKPIYRPGQTVHVKAVLRVRERDELRPFNRPDVELTASDTNDKVILRRTLKVDSYGAVHASFPVPDSAALGHYALRVVSGDREATSAFEVQEYRKPGVPGARFSGVPGTRLPGAPDQRSLAASAARRCCATAAEPVTHTATATAAAHTRQTAVAYATPHAR